MKTNVTHLLLIFFGLSVANGQSVCDPRWFQGTSGACIGANSLFTGDLDNDGRTEVVCGAGAGFGTGLFWYVLRYDATTHEYRQVWMSSPVDYTSDDPVISCIRCFDTDNDSIYEIFVIYEDGSVEIYNGDTMDKIRSFQSPLTDVKDLVFADADNDGQKEIVMCDEEHTCLFNGFTFVQEAAFPYGSHRFAAGNVDTDPQVELVYSGGTVLRITGASATVKWNIYTPGETFSFISLSDTDNDGMNEIIIARSYASIDIWDADTKLLQGAITGDFDMDALTLADVNGDQTDEIIAGDGQWGAIHCYNPTTLKEMWAISNPEHGVTQIAISDADDDGQLEVLWGAGWSSTGPDFLYVYNVATLSSEFRSKAIVGPFYDVESGDVDGDGQMELVTVSFKSASEFESGILSVFDGITGNLEWQSDGNFFHETWQGIHTLELADVTGDATKEIIVGTCEFYNGALYIVSGVTHQLISSRIYTPEEVDNILALAVSDVDMNGLPDIVIADDSYLYIVDPANLSITWKSDVIPGFGMQSVKTGNVDGDPNPEMVVCSGKIYVYDGITHELWISDESHCTNIDLYDWDGDGVPEIISCTDEGRILMIDRQTGQTTTLLQTALTELGAVRVANLDHTGPPEFVLTANGRVLFANLAGDLISTTVFGEWAGWHDGLKLSDIDLDGKTEIFAGTRYQVVEISEECSQCLGFKVAVQTTNVSCRAGNDGQATAAVSGGTGPFYYLWNTGSTLRTIASLTPGEYMVNVTDSRGCPAGDTATIVQSVIGTTIAGTSVSCSPGLDGTATITLMEGTPPFQFAWSNGATIQSLSGLAPGNYTCVVTDHMSCSSTNSIKVERDTIIVDLIRINPKCFGQGGGQAIAQVLSGEAPFVFLWGSVPGGPIINELPSGNYVLTVSDAKNCSATNSFTITEPPLIVMQTSFLPDDSTTAFPDGQATVNVSGGVPPYYYRWDDMFHQTSSTATNLTNGHYEVQVSDQAGCFRNAGVDVFPLGTDGKTAPGAGLEIYPNPASHETTVVARFAYPVSGRVDLVNAAGEVIRSQEFEQTRELLKTFNLDGLPGSIYLFVVKTADYTLTKTLVKN